MTFENFIEKTASLAAEQAKRAESGRTWLRDQDIGIFHQPGVSAQRLNQRSWLKLTEAEWEAKALAGLAERQAKENLASPKPKAERTESIINQNLTLNRS